MRRRFCAVMAVMIIGGVGAMLSLSQCGAQEGPKGFIQGVKTDKEAYTLRDRITITYTIRNDGRDPITFSFSSGKQHDIWITNGDIEVYRRSRGMNYIQSLTSFTLAPGESKTFTAQWNQKDFRGRDIGPGPYVVHAKLLPSRSRTSETTCTFEVGDTNAAPIPVTVAEAVKRSNELVGHRVSISAIYRGWRPEPGDPNTKDGPPVTRSDWAISDGSGSMYVNGPVNLDPQRDFGTKVTVVGKLKKTNKGQIYISAESTTIGR